MESKNITGHQLDSLMLDYNKYKRFGDLSKSNEKLKKIHKNRKFLGMQIPAKLKYVNIFFDTPTFDRITKDKSAKESTLNIQSLCFLIMLMLFSVTIAT